MLTLTLALTLTSADPVPLTVVVMDPLAAELSCPCVKGYAQRDYEKLSTFLSGQLGRPVKLVYGETLAGALKSKTDGKADLVIGKRSVITHEAKAIGRELTPLAALTGLDGETTQTGLFVVPKDDPAKSVADLKGYRILFGPADCAEKHRAALAALKQAGVTPPSGAAIETVDSCSTGATKLLELGPEVRAAAVVSSYAKPLLEGCGTVKKGDLRVVGSTQPVPFVTAFVRADLPAGERDKVLTALKALADHPALMQALETKAGFVPVESVAKKN